MTNFLNPAAQKTVLIVGCDTEVGKTVTTSALAAYWQRYYPEQSLGLMKLLQTGIGDQEHYQQLFGAIGHWQIVTPQQFSTPVAPPIAAEREGKIIDLALVWQTLQALQQHHQRVLVEALGSLGSPVTAELTVADIAGLWRLDCLLVVPVKLGAIGQAIAQVALANQTNVTIKGLVLSCSSSDAEAHRDDWAAPAMLEQFTRLPVLGTIPFLDAEARLDPKRLAQAAASLDLEKMAFFPNLVRPHPLNPVGSVA
ncbi:MAG: Dethiobiotin synthetase [Cyanobacteriota bacterium]|jgi:dethiobiotin synthetase